MNMYEYPFNQYPNEPVEPDMPDPESLEVIDKIDIETIISNSGFVIRLEIRVYADGSEKAHSYLLEDTCDPPLDWIPF